MLEADDLKQRVTEKLSTVIDPETGDDIIRMRLVQNLEVDLNGKVTYVFRPSSPLCPIAVPLTLMIIKVINETPGVTEQSMTVVDYAQAEQLNELLKTLLVN